MITQIEQVAVDIYTLPQSEQEEIRIDLFTVGEVNE